MIIGYGHPEKSQMFVCVNNEALGHKLMAASDANICAALPLFAEAQFDRRKDEHKQKPLTGIRESK